MALDPQIAPIVELVNAAAAEAPSIWDQTVEERRDGYRKLLEPLPPGPDVAEVDDSVIDGPEGAIPVRVYRPEGANGIIVFFHGGGWTIGDLDTHDEVCRSMAVAGSCAVVSVGYRLGPEARFPAAVVDCYAALEWVAEHRDDLTGDPSTPVVVAGDSAGGNLAAVMCLLARDLDGPDIAAQLLVYPAVDLRMEGYPSLGENAEGYVLTFEGMEWFRSNYLASPDDALDHRASPILAPSLADLPPALVLTAEFDPLRDEGAAYADALRAAGVGVDHHCYEGMVHIFFQLGPAVGAGADAVGRVAAAARAAFDAASDPAD